MVEDLGVVSESTAVIQSSAVVGAASLPELMHGEQLAVDISARVGRTNRSRVKVRVIGNASLTWVDLVYQWGGCVEVVVLSNAQLRDYLKSKYQSTVMSLPQAVKLPPHEPWHGVVLATARTLQDRVDLQTLFDAWLPGNLIIAVHGGLSRRETMQVVPNHSALYSLKISKGRHSEFGGATTSVWNFIHLSRLDRPFALSELMTSEHYTQTLQASLDDTVGVSQVKYRFEPCFGQDYIGLVTLKTTGTQLRVFDADGLAPDLAAIQPSRFWFFWVSASSVWTRKRKILRPVQLHELFAIWDFEGKLSCHSLSRKESMTLLQHRLYSPPGKLARLVARHMLQLESERVYPTTAPIVVPIQAGKSSDIPFSPMEQQADVRAQAACPDDADIDLSIWAADNETPEMAAARNTLRKFAVRWWACFHERKAREWLRQQSKIRDIKRDVSVIEDCIFRMKSCKYFKWVRGSRIFYYRLPAEWQEEFRDGIKCWQLPGTVLPQGRMRNIPTETREQELLTRDKIFRLWFNRYLESGKMRLVIPRFTVPKADDVRVVWDSKANGHNSCLWAPSFILGDFRDLEEIVVKWLSLPVERYLKMGCPDEDYSREAASFIKSWQADIDVGAQFNNFPAHHEDRPYTGVRMISTRNDGSLEPEWFLRFSVLHFGGRCSPAIASICQQRILEWAKGPPNHPKSPYSYAKVILNLPTSPTWDPSLPRVMRIRDDGELAAAQVDYVDDIHPTARGRDNMNAVAAAKWLKSRMNSVGNQADDRKYRQPTCKPGAWKGEIMHTDQPLPRKSTTAKKWLRFKNGLDWVITQAEVGDFLATAELRRIAGLGVNVTEVYLDARPYLKGFFNAIEAFRIDRDRNGWRIRAKAELDLTQSGIQYDCGLTPIQEEAAMNSAEALEINDSSTAAAMVGYPLLTAITPELIDHCEALIQLFEGDTPREVFIRPASATQYRYYIGDASAEGFGGVTQFPDGTIRGRRGLWDAKFAEGGSNVREAINQVNHLIREIRSGIHDGCALWPFTDNAVWSAVWLKGLSTAKHLFNLVLELRIECRVHEVHCTVCHISGNRMIESGIDGWSRGDFETGISLGYDLRNYLPLSKGCFDVAGATLIPWLRSWMQGDYSGPLSPEGWFWDGHLPGIHIWAPPPAAALIALKQLSRSRQKRRHELTHVVLIPRILYWEEWQTRFEKEVDIWFMLHPGTVWPHFAHEPLVVGLSFPMHRSYPWLLRMESEKVVEIGRSLSALSKTSNIRVGHYLRQLWSNPRELPEVHGGLVCKMLQGT